MNFPIHNQVIQKLNETAYNKVVAYMHAHAAEFAQSDEPTHARAQAIADAVNTEDPSKCGEDSELAECLIECLKTLRANTRAGFYPNACIACGYDPAVVFRVADNESEGKSSCECITFHVCDWSADDGAAPSQH